MIKSFGELGLRTCKEPKAVHHLLHEKRKTNSPRDQPSMSSGPSNALLTSSSLCLLSSISNGRVYGLSIDDGALSSLDDVLVGSLGSTGLGTVVGCGLGKLVLNGCLRLFEHVSGGGRGGLGEVGLCDGETGATNSVRPSD